MRNKLVAFIAVLLIPIAVTAQIGGPRRSYISPSSTPGYYMALQKYWWYRYTLVNDYMKIGDKCGESLIGKRDYNDEGLGGPHLHFLDQTTFLGNYILMLAAEHAWLSKANLSTSRTEYELYYAIKAFDRLDLTAEERSRDFAATQNCENINPMHNEDPFDLTNNDLNGFFIRDDVPLGFESDNHQHFNRAKICRTVSGTMGDVIIRTDEIMDPDWSQRFPNIPRHPVEMSLDQVASLYLGFALVVKLVNSSAQYNGENLKRLAENAILRISYYTSRPGYPSSWTPWNQAWRIMNPTTGKLVYGMGLDDWNQYNAQNYGFDKGAIAYPCAPGIQAGLLRIGASWNNDDIAKINVMSSMAAPYYQVYNAAKAGWQLNNYAGHSLLFPTSFATVANNWKNPIGLNVTKQYVRLMSAHQKLRFPHLPLVYRLINGGDMFNPQNFPWNQMSYQELINKSPKCLRFKLNNSEVSEGEWEWGCQDRLSEAFKRYEGDNGDFPGEDFCALVALYALNEPNWAKVLNNPYYEEEFSVSFPYAVGSRYVGTTNAPAAVKTLEYLSSKSKITANGGAIFQNAKVIDLLPGFEAEKGCQFSTIIKDYSCSNCTHREIGGDFFMNVTEPSVEDNDDFVMDTLYYNDVTPFEIPEADEEQYEPNENEMLADSIWYMQQIYDENDTNAINYFEYLANLNNGTEGEYKFAKANSITSYKESDVLISPNPSNAIFTINTNINQYGYVIYDNIGRVIERKNNLSNNYNINLKNKTRGFYLLNILSKTGTVFKSFKLILE